ncbi:two-component system CheB/CheR fusion protein [Amaricoccus macauensis]|uniref:Two-component system CheB/CheR fusion protein n=1 Tax=Amaricoccus macauensis TaxID=57001 RepID=A0A840SQT3_9RHOB|nr:CheR family methyltransferase [Amaricoccus macauensis]MBB5222838.1 two-component system CheB/CheR fusion protein [Amaricoccus macauensis]
MTKKADDNKKRQDFPVVGIGASAGGIPALERFFSSAPANGNIAFVIVMHLASRRDSVLVDIVDRFTPMPTSVVQGETAILPGHVYVIPPDVELKLRDGHLVTAKAANGNPHSPVDGFLASLAVERGENAACVILSGTGSDGTQGLRAIKEYGGLALAQEAAEYDGMMRSAVATGLVDFVMPAEEMPKKLFHYFGHLRETAQRKDSDGLRREVAHHLPAICALLRGRTGHDFSEYKDSTIIRRIQRRMQVLQRETPEAYLERLKAEPREVDLLFNDLLIGVTSFFRDPQSFEALDRQVITPLMENVGPDTAIRVWVPGCSTGEEAYSIAMLLHERLSPDRKRPVIQIFASDIDERGLEVGRLGRYPASIADQVSERRLKRFFVREDGTYRVVSELRESILFSTHDLLRDPPFSKLDLISCRNLLIYMNGELQDRVIPLFNYALRMDGYLFLGSSENVTRHSRLFATIDKAHRIFRRRPDTRLRLPEFPLSTHAPRLTPVPPRPRADQGDGNLQRLAERQVLDRFGPAHAVVNASGDVLHISARTGKYLELPAGSPDNNIIGMARPGLRLDLRGALHRAASTGETVVQNEITVGTNGGRQTIDLVVQPMRRGDMQDGTFLVIFRDIGGIQSEEGFAHHTIEDGEASTIQHLEHELRMTTERLQTTTEELESSNEELKSANEELSSINEELQSSNEELETSKEELSSMNEELQTVNSELTARVEELSRANSDIQNLLESTQIATVFLDRELCVKKFTPAARELFYLVESDEGRPISHLRARFKTDTLAQDTEQVLRRLVPVERTVEGLDNGTRYAMRILPYRTVADQISGVVITFVDITRITEAEARIQELTDSLRDRVVSLETLLDLVPVGIFIMSGESPGQAEFNRAAARLLGRDDGELTPRMLSAELPLHAGSVTMPRTSQPLPRAAHTREPVPPFEAELRREDGSSLDVLVSATPLASARGRPPGAIAAMVDITERRQAEDHQQMLLDELQHRAKNILATVTALARKTSNGSPEGDQATAALVGRLQAMARTHELLSRDVWRGVPVDDLLRATLNPYFGARRDEVTLAGPRVVIEPKASSILGMVLYELASNAVQYGALGRQSGRLAVTWSVGPREERRWLTLLWKESLGATLQAPEARGFGTSFIERSLSYELFGSASLAFEPDGLSCVLEFPLDQPERS